MHSNNAYVMVSNLRGRLLEVEQDRENESLDSQRTDILRVDFNAICD